MITIFVNHRSDLTNAIALEPWGDCYRTTCMCNCTDKGNKRQAVLFIHGTELVKKVIRCKACAKIADYQASPQKGKEADNGNI